MRTGSSIKPAQLEASDDLQQTTAQKWPSARPDGGRGPQLKANPELRTDRKGYRGRSAQERCRQRQRIS